MRQLSSSSLHYPKNSPFPVSMARVSKKALRPRSYVLGRLSPERILRLQGGVRKLLEKERLEALKARAAVRAVERTEAQRHAESILAGVQEADPGNEQIRALVKELDELRQKKHSLFAALKKKLDDEAVASKDTPAQNGSNRDSQPATKPSNDANVHQSVRPNHASHTS